MPVGVDLLGLMPPLVGERSRPYMGSEAGVSHASGNGRRVGAQEQPAQRGSVVATVALVVDPPRHREHLLPGRPHRLRVSYSDAELAAVRAGAAQAGLTLAGFVAAAALAAAQGQPPPAPPVSREAVAELAQAHRQVRRLGTNLNQAAAKLNSGQTPPVWLERAVALAERALTRVEAAAARLNGSPADEGVAPSARLHSASTSGDAAPGGLPQP
jgi:hypothetical protein